MDIYDRLGVRKIINSMGTISAIGGSVMPPEVYDAMREANESYVFIDELERKAGEYIANLLGIPAAFVSSGATDSLLLSAAACMTGTDQHRIRSLPNTQGWKNEIVVHKDYGDEYCYMYQAMRATGAKLVEVGTREKLTLQDVERGLTENTAAIELWLRYRDQPKISEVYPIAQRAGVPIIVDAAGQTPPRSTLTEPLEEGADLVAISGGKGLYGPQGTGLILGSSKELIDACRLNASPHSAIGRAMKVGRESVCALIAALEVYLERDEEADKLEYKRRSDYVVQELEGIPGVKARTEMADPTSRPVVPRVYIQLDSDFPLSAKDVQQHMLAGQPPIAVGSDFHTPNPRTVRVDVLLLREWELKAVARRLKEVLSTA